MSEHHVIYRIGARRDTQLRENNSNKMTRNKLHRKQSETTGSHTPEIVAVAGYFWGYLATSGIKI